MSELSLFDGEVPLEIARQEAGAATPDAWGPWTRNPMKRQPPEPKTDYSKINWAARNEGRQPRK